MMKQIKIGSLVKITLWDNPHYCDHTYGIVLPREGAAEGRYYRVLSKEGVQMYSKQEIEVISEVAT